jgi:hypothetical protein
MSGNPVSIQHQRYARLLSENTLQGTGTHRTSGRQAQTLQAYRTSMREDGAELRLVRRACSRLYLDQIRPHGLRGLAAESAHRVTGVASLILLADIGDQRLRALYLDFEGGDQRIFRINDDVSRFSLNFKADRKLHLCSPLSTFNR